MKRWKIAIVGAGHMAQEHARAIHSLTEVDIAGVCSRTRSRAEALAQTYSVPVFNSIEEMYDATRADAVVVAVNELSMPEVCGECFRFPWVCLLEKPAGVDLAAAERILDNSRRTGSRAYVALNRRSYAATRQALAELAADDSPRLISILDQEDQEAARGAGQPEEVVRNWMYANSIHLIDYFSFMARGDVVSVEHGIPWSPDSPGFVVATIRFSSGDVGVYQVAWNAPGPWSVSVTNRSLRLEMRPIEKLAVQRRGERRLTDVAPESIDSEYKPGLRYQAEQLVEALKGHAPNLASLEEATRSMALCARIYGLGSRD
ncbi:Predicted dehydrogenase [Nitrobacter sp. Nb-311A]|uniref:Gfo/Idh/MocA family protein n=1 Tax=Nitrobacter sp. Nb-311A TaxID=314253 RepID=UPI0000687AA6|nr:Gfo/Idh/MocA family oxidoreductase [Nitrobacter sp. Nb-311A]EAQ36399.1 Predicted dehydrogenase [Nitrobacter sp. Nb-311A]